MGYDEKTVERVRRILARRRDVVEKRMVGGLSFMVNGTMCCGVTGTALMVRVGPEARERFLAKSHVRPMTLGDRTLIGFICVDQAGFRTDTALRKWVQHSLDFVSMLPGKEDQRRRTNAVTDAAEKKWRAIANSQLAKRGVTSGTGFGHSEGLRISGKIFAMLVKGDLVAKLPKARVDDLTASGVGHNFDPGHGRLMKEWIAVSPTASQRWRALVEEAREFVGSIKNSRTRSGRGDDDQV